MKLSFLFLAATLLPLSAPAALKLHAEGAKQNFLYERDGKALAANVQLVFRTGNLADPKGKEGLASIAFQALERGTEQRGRKEFFAAVERIGAAMSVDVASNRTILNLYAISENLEEAIGLLAESVLRPALKDGEIKSLIEEEIAQLNQELSNNRALLRRVTRQALYRGTPLAFPPSGTIQGLKNITPEDVRQFLKSQLKAGNLVVGATSSHPERSVRVWLEKAFKALPEGAVTAAPAPEMLMPEGRTVYLLDRKGSSTTEIAVAQPGIKADRPDRETLELAQFIFGDDMSSRLMQTLRGKNGWTYGATAGYSMLEIPRRHGGAYLIYSFPQSQFTSKTLLKTLELYEEFVKKGATAKELSFAKKSIMNSYPFKFATSQGRLTARLYQYLDGAANLAVPEFRAEINKISLSSLKKSVTAAHDPRNLVIVMVGDPNQIEPLAKEIPGVKNVVKVADPMAAF